MGADRIGRGGGSIGVAMACVVVVAALGSELAGQLADGSTAGPDPRLIVRLACVGATVCLVAWVLDFTSRGRGRRDGVGRWAGRWVGHWVGHHAAIGGRARHATPLFLAATLALLAWNLSRTSTVAADDLARLAPRHPHEDGPFVRLRGTVLDHPTASARVGSMAAFDTRPPRWRLRLDAALMAFSDRPPVPCRGRVMVGIAGERPPVAPGDWIEVCGSLSGFAPRINPGGFDGRSWARREGLSAALWLDDRSAIRPAPPPNEGGPEERWWPSALAGPVGALLRARHALRTLAEASLIHDVPAWTSPETRALLLAMFLGSREPELAELEAAFRRTGSMHLVAISGFNLAVLATAAIAVASLGSRRATTLHGAGPTRPRLAPWLVIALVSLYLCIVESQPAVLRAGAMILIARFGEALGRHWTAHGIYCLAAVLLLAARPADIGNAGFQLSFAVVAALIWLAPCLQRRWFGPLPADGVSIGRVLGRRAAMAVAAAAAAWLAATPLSLHHFGIVSPLAAPLSLLAVPLASALLVVGYAKMLLTPFVPLSGWALGWPLATLATTLAATVKAADRLPGAAIALPAPGAAWTITALVCLCVAITAPRLLARRAGWAAVILCALWPARALLPTGGEPVLRLDMLAVGDGTCILVRAGPHAILFDAGSLDVSVGDRVVVPALHALGVRALDAIVVSHANLDHFDAVIEVVDAFEVGEVMLTSQFMAEAAQAPRGAPALLLALLAKRQIQPTVVHFGAERRWARTRWRWLHPARDDRPRRVNDTSQVILVEVETDAQPTRVLLCGDIEAQAMAAVLERRPALAADIVEMPHHGSWREATVDFLGQLQPRVLLQSTGRRRLLDDRWEPWLARRDGASADATHAADPARRADAVHRPPTRLMTARDGACRVEIDRLGRIRATGFATRLPIAFDSPPPAPPAGPAAHHLPSTAHPPNEAAPRSGAQHSDQYPSGDRRSPCIAQHPITLQPRTTPRRRPPMAVRRPRSRAPPLHRRPPSPASTRCLHLTAARQCGTEASPGSATAAAGRHPSTACAIWSTSVAAGAPPSGWATTSPRASWWPSRCRGWACGRRNSSPAWPRKGACSADCAGTQTWFACSA